MYVVCKPNLEASNGSFGIGFPSGSGSKAFECCNICVNIQVFHLEFHQLVIGSLLSSRVSPSILKGSVKLCPVDFGSVWDWGCGSGSSIECCFLGINPSVDIWSFDVCKCKDDSVIWVGDEVVGLVEATEACEFSAEGF